MQYRTLGSTGIDVSRLALGGGPIAALMTGDDRQRQRQVIERALEAGINWIDTAATYGQGQSERSIGEALSQLGGASQMLVATKVRLVGDDLDEIDAAVRRSLRESLARLQLPRVTLLQLHNAITLRRDDEPTSLAPGDILGPGGVLQAMQRLQRDGLVAHLGLTALGQPQAMREVIRSGAFATIQTPYNLLNPSAGMNVPAGFQEADYGNIIDESMQRGMGVFAIRVLGAGALAGQQPAAHTRSTKFFPLDLYRRDQRRAARLVDMVGEGVDLKEIAVRFALSHEGISSAIIGFAQPQHVDEANEYLQAGSLPQNLLAKLRRLEYHAVAEDEVEGSAE